MAQQDEQSAHDNELHMYPRSTSGSGYLFIPGDDIDYVEHRDQL